MVSFKWYDHREKSARFFLNLEKKCSVQNRVRKLIVKEKDITDPKETFNNNKPFCKTHFKQNSSKTNVNKKEFFNSLHTKTLTDQEPDLRENEIGETNLFDSMKSMKKTKLLVLIDYKKNF